MSWNDIKLIADLNKLMDELMEINNDINTL